MWICKCTSAQIELEFHLVSGIITVGVRLSLSVEGVSFDTCRYGMYINSTPDDMKVAICLLVLGFPF